ncbi:MAG: DUF4878 domain-containing protein [Comamonas sp.]
MSVTALVSRRRCLFAGVALVSALNLAACATAPTAPTAEQSQEALIQRFYRLLADGDFNRCIPLVSARNLTKQQLAGFEPTLRQMLAGAKGKIDSKGGLQQVAIVERVVSEKDQVTKLRVLLRYADGNTRRERINVFLEDGVWKVQL